VNAKVETGMSVEITPQGRLSTHPRHPRQP